MALSSSACPRIGTDVDVGLGVGAAVGLGVEVGAGVTALGVGRGLEVEMGAGTGDVVGVDAKVWAGVFVNEGAVGSGLAVGSAFEEHAPASITRQEMISTMARFMAQSIPLCMSRVNSVLYGYTPSVLVTFAPVLCRKLATSPFERMTQV